MRSIVLTGVLALSIGLLTGCQGGDDSSGGSLPPPVPGAGAADPDAPPATGGPIGSGVPGVPGVPGQTPQMPVAPAGGTKVAQGKSGTSFDNPPPGMPGITNPGNGGGAPLNPTGMDMSGGMPTTGAAGGGAGVAKPAPIKPGQESKYRRDPFVSFVRFIIEKPPAYTLAVPERLAALPKEPPPPPVTSPNEMLPLPPVPRRVAGVLYNGAITAILETGNPPASETRIIAPGAKVPSGVPGIPDLTVDSIAMDRLVLRAEDGRTVEVKLSGLSPAVLQSMQGQFGGGGGGFGPNGGFGGPPGAAGGGFTPPGAGGGADLK